jgi:hypothetical protein
MRNKVASIVIIFLFVACGLLDAFAFISFNANAETWNIEYVHESGFISSSTSLALDASGNPHISYLGDDGKKIMYTTWTGTEWTSVHIGPVELLHGVQTSIAVDNQGNPHIGYLDNSMLDLKYAKCENGIWRRETISIGLTSSLSRSLSLDVDSNGYPHIVCFELMDNTLKYVRWTGDEWEIETIESGTGAGPNPSIAIDSNDIVHISYLYREEWTFSDSVRYASGTSGNWNFFTVDSSGNFGETSLALDSKEDVHICYYDRQTGSLKYARQAEFRWEIETVDDHGDVGGSPSIAVDSNDHVHISYLDIDKRDLKYARWDGNNWFNETLDGLDDLGYYTSLAVDSSDNVHISYWDRTNRYLKYAKTEKETEEKNIYEILSRFSILIILILTIVGILCIALFIRVHNRQNTNAKKEQEQTSRPLDHPPQQESEQITLKPPPPP